VNDQNTTLNILLLTIKLNILKYILKNIVKKGTEKGQIFFVIRDLNLKLKQAWQSDCSSLGYSSLGYSSLGYPYLDSTN
jgi:hypothetical protein